LFAESSRGISPRAAHVAQAADIALTDARRAPLVIRRTSADRRRLKGGQRAAAHASIGNAANGNVTGIHCAENRQRARLFDQDRSTLAKRRPIDARLDGPKWYVNPTSFVREAAGVDGSLAAGKNQQLRVFAKSKRG